MAGPAIATARRGFSGPEPEGAETVSVPDLVGGEIPPGPMFELIELFFFAYRDFVGDADRALAAFDFGRAHHRVLHFVHRHPGLTVAELLDILKITKQSLNRVMKDLTDKGFIAVRAGTDDRRRRLLQVTPEGCRLALDLARLQSERFRRTFAALPPDTGDHVAAFLRGMIDPADRQHVEDLVRDGRQLPDAGGRGRRERAA